MEETDQPRTKTVKKKRVPKKQVDTKASAGMMLYMQGADLKMIAEALNTSVKVVEEWYTKNRWASVSRQILKDKLTANKAPETPTTPNQSSPLVVDAFGKGLSVEVANNRQEIWVRAGRYHEVLDELRTEMMMNPKKRNAVALGALVKAEQVIAQIRSQALGDYNDVPTANVQHAMAPITVIFPPLVAQPRPERVIEATVTEVTVPTKPKKKQLIPGIEV